MFVKEALGVDVAEALLICIEEAGGTPLGRTAIQKLLYFAAQKSLIVDVFHPHYYGPYSDVVLDSLNSLVSLDFLKEEVESAETSFGDWRRYSYRLTEEGKEVIRSIRKKEKKECTQLKTMVLKAKEITNLDISILSYAAKAHYILKTEDRPMEPSEIREEAQKVRWSLSENQIASGLNLLESLGLVVQN